MKKFDKDKVYIFTDASHNYTVKSTAICFLLVYDGAIQYIHIQQIPGNSKTCELEAIEHALEMIKNHYTDLMNKEIILVTDYHNLYNILQSDEILYTKNIQAGYKKYYDDFIKNMHYFVQKCESFDIYIITKNKIKESDKKYGILKCMHIFTDTLLTLFNDINQKLTSSDIIYLFQKIEPHLAKKVYINDSLIRSYLVEQTQEYLSKDITILLK